MKLKILLVFPILLFSVNTLAFCTTDGAFGIKFGNRVSKDAKRLEGGKASIYYLVKAPTPHPAFDEYQVRIDTRTKKIFEITAIKIITPSQERLTDEQVAQGKLKASEAAYSFLALLTDEQRANIIPNEYDLPQWELPIEDKVIMEIEGFGPWRAEVQCVDLAGERLLYKRVLPEIFE